MEAKCFRLEFGISGRSVGGGVLRALVEENLLSTGGYGTNYTPTEVCYRTWESRACCSGSSGSESSVIMTMSRLGPCARDEEALHFRPFNFRLKSAMLDGKVQALESCRAFIPLAICRSVAFSQM